VTQPGHKARGNRRVATHSGVDGRSTRRSPLTPGPLSRAVRERGCRGSGGGEECPTACGDLGSRWPRHSAWSGEARLAPTDTERGRLTTVTDLTSIRDQHSTVVPAGVRRA